MKPILQTLLALLAMAPAVATNAQTPTPEVPPHFPKVTGDNLNGKTFHLPDDLGGERNIVLVPFERWHQTVVDTWLPMLSELAKADPKFRYYEVPTLGKMMPFAQSFIDNGMRSGIPDTGVRAITITLYIDKVAFRKSLHLPDEKTIYVLLVDKSGNIYWRGEGAFTEKQGASLKAALSASRKAP